jgi:hypothetical protein
VSGGCGSGELSRQVNKVGYKTRRGLLGIEGESDMCFRDAILCSLFSRELFIQYTKSEEVKCIDHRRFCRCRDIARRKFDKDRTKGMLTHILHNIMIPI